jgi:hypothetical protein
VGAESPKSNQTDGEAARRLVDRRMPLSRRRRAYRWILFLATLVAVSWFLARNIGRLRTFDIRWDAGRIAASYAVFAAAYFVRFLAWLRLSAAMRISIPTPLAARAYFLSMLGRYIPGKIGLALVRIEAYRESPAGAVVLATAVELICSIAAALLLAFIGFASTPVYLPGGLRWLPLICILPLVALLSPPVTRRIAAALSARDPVALARVPSFRAVLSFVGLYALPGFLHGFGFFLVIRSLTEISAANYLAVTGAYYAAALIGLAAFFAPGGLGVREGILFLVLPALIGKEAAVFAAVIARMATLAAELTLAGSSVAAARSRRD